MSRSASEGSESEEAEEESSSMRACWAILFVLGERLWGFVDVGLCRC